MVVVLAGYLLQTHTNHLSRSTIFLDMPPQRFLTQDLDWLQLIE